MSAQATNTGEKAEFKPSFVKHNSVSSLNIFQESKRENEIGKDVALTSLRKSTSALLSRPREENVESQYNRANEDRISLSARRSQTLQAIKKLSSMDVVLPDKEKLNVLNAPIYDETLNGYDSLSKKDRPILKWIYFLRILVVWVIFLVVGTVFYAHYDDFGWRMGFYMAINVGYSIGWGYPLDPNEGSEWFSVCFIIFGATIALAGVVFLIRLSLENRKSWYSRALQQEILSVNNSICVKIYYYILLNEGHFMSIVIWAVWVMVFVVWSMNTQPALTEPPQVPTWDFVQALYLAVSSYSTCGCWSIPNNSTEDQFAIVAGFTAIGAPLMLTMITSVSTMFGLNFVSYVTKHEYKDIVYEKIKKEELKVLKDFALDDGSGRLDLREFIIISAVRMKAIDPKLIKYLLNTFRIYDSNSDGYIYHKDIVEDYDESDNMQKTRVLNSDLDSANNVEAQNTRTNSNTNLSLNSLNQVETDSLPPLPPKKLFTPSTPVVLKSKQINHLEDAGGAAEFGIRPGENV